jgi:hypothetical protein
MLKMQIFIIGPAFKALIGLLLRRSVQLKFPDESLTFAR